MKSKQSLSDLNPDQQAAVTHRTGPLLIIAGAGTGKTTVITRRIAWLIAQKLASSSEILALTFTDKAAGEMEARVDQLLPLGMTDATISTFHAFGDARLREHVLDLGLPPEFRVLGTSEQELFLAERWDAIEGLTELRPVTNPRKFIHPILRVISRAQDELVSPEKYRKTAQRLLRQATDDESRRAAGRQLDIATIYAAYEHFKAEEGVIDFGDQITKLIGLLDREAGILKRLRARFKFILVDEFQDTNIAQFELVKRLLGPHHNITVVGDDNQAIYKFRGAAISNILSFRENFPNARQVVLRHNYRSTQAILDVSYTLIKHNDPDTLEAKLGINKQLIGAEEGTRPTFHWYAHDVDELDALVENVKSVHTGHLRGVAGTTSEVSATGGLLRSEGGVKAIPLNQIAILVRTNALLAPIAAALQRADVAVAMSSDQGFSSRPEIRGVIALMQALVHPSDSLAHLKLALSPYYALDARAIFQINDAAKRAHRSFDEVLHDPNSVAWKTLASAVRESVEKFRDEIDQFRTLIGQKSLGEVLYDFLKAKRILQAHNTQYAIRNTSSGQHQPSLFDQQPEQDQLTIIQNLSAVFEAIKRYEGVGRDRFAPRFVDRLDELLSHIVPPTVDLGPDVPAVQLSTVHAAKGLEFDVVFLPFLTADRFPSRRQAEPLGLPDELIAETLPTGDEHSQEERRLAYVAMTRARRALHLSGAATSGAGVRTKRPSPFMFEALGIRETPPPIQRVSSAARIHQFAPITTPAPTSLSLPAYDGVYFLSPAMIETYQQDPYLFYWRYVLKAPQPPSRHLNYGNAIHAAIEAYHRLRLKIVGNTSEVSAESGLLRSEEDVKQLEKAVLARYREAWVGEGFDSKTDEERQFKHGEEVVKRFIARANTAPLPSQIEETVTLLVPGARIRGRIDAIYRERGEIRDFKTSDVKDAQDAQAKIKDNLPIKIYALAYANRFGELPKRLVLDFVEKDLEGVLEPSDAILAETKEAIRQTIEGIRSGHFDPNPQNRFRDYE